MNWKNQESAGKDIGSLKWTERTGGALSGREKIMFVLGAIPNLLAATIKKVFSKNSTKKIDLFQLAPPNTTIINEAINILKQASDPAMVNHCFRTAYWTLVVMKREKPELTQQEIEEAWVAALLHDIGFDIPPRFGEFTLACVSIVHQIATKFGWDKNSEQKASEAITLNPNGRVDKEKFGLLAWAMNVGGYGEAFLGPYRILMHPENIKELESMYPRHGFYSIVPGLVDKELRRFPNQRFAILKKIGFTDRRLKD